MLRIIVVAAFLFVIAEVGNSLECNKMICSGSLEGCKNETEMCDAVVGETQCATLVVNNEGTIRATLGCATPRDCKAAEKTCSNVMMESEKDKLKTSCKSMCCDTDNCNEHLLKGVRQCFSCMSSTSSSECTDSSVPTVCGLGERCFKLMSELYQSETQTTIKTYAKGCYTEEQCNDKSNNIFTKDCNKYEDNNCELVCCDDEDMCNAGSFNAVSGLVLLACLLMMVLRF